MTLPPQLRDLLRLSLYLWPALLVWLAVSPPGSDGMDGVGRGPITLTRSVVDALEIYRGAPKPGLFVVSIDGKTARYNRDGGTALKGLIGKCEKRSKGVPCKLFARGGEVVWENPGVYLPASDWLDAPRAAETTWKGPGKALGLVLYVPGHGTSGRVRQGHRVPPFLLEFDRRGFDVAKLNYPTVRISRYYARYLEDAITHYRGLGYKKIVMAGQSAGAWLSILTEMGGKVRVDAILASVPALYGKSELDYAHKKATGLSFRNETKLQPLLKRLAVKTLQRLKKGEIDEKLRVALLFFDKDPYDPKGRAKRVQRLLTRKGMKLALDAWTLAHPAGIEGHSGWWRQGFAARYGACLVDFTLQGNGSACPPPSNPGPDLLTTEEALKKSPARLLTGEEIRRLVTGRTETSRRLKDGTLATIHYLPPEEEEGAGVYIGRFRAQTAQHYSQRSTHMGRWKVKGDELCILDLAAADPSGRYDNSRCYRLYRWDETVTMAVAAKNGAVVDRLTHEDGDELGLGAVYRKCQGAWEKSEKKKRRCGYPQAHWRVTF